MGADRKARRNEVQRALPFPPRGLDAEQAAAYCGISTALLRRHGPSPKSVGGRLVWDLRALDQWFDGQRGAIAPLELSEEAKALAALG